MVKYNAALCADIARVIACDLTSKTLLAGGFQFPFNEGSEAHKALRKGITQTLGRNMKAGERKRLCWLVAGTTKQLNTVAQTAQTRHKALLRSYNGQNIAGNKALKNIV